jgi:hypothetical protein
MRWVKRAIFILMLLILVPVVAAVGVTALAYTAGTIHVEVDSPDAEFSVPIPAGFVGMALAFIPRAVCRDMPDEIRQQWDAMEVAALEIERIPDAVLVDVEGRGDERVSISKRGDGFVVDARSGDEGFRVSFPASTMGNIAYHMRRTCGG